MKNKNEAATSEEMPASEELAATPEGMPAEELSTTDTLFPELREDSTVQDEVIPEEVAEEEPEALPAKSSDQMVEVTIDGVTQEVPLAEVLKGYQTGKHLSMEGRKIGEERKALEELKAEILAATKAPEAPQLEEDDDDYADPSVKKLRKELEALKSVIAQQGEALSTTEQVVRPIAYRNSLNVVDATLKEQGYEDFMEFVPSIEAKIAALPVEEQPNAWTMDFFKNQYAMLKLEALKKAPEKESVEVRANPKVVPIESANSRSSQVDDSALAREKAMKKARETGDWTEVYRLKGIAGFK